MSSPARAKRRPSRLRSAVWFAVSFAGFCFGFVVLNIAGGVPDPGAGEKALMIVFGIVWFAFWIGAMVTHVLNYRAAARLEKTE